MPATKVGFLPHSRLGSSGSLAKLGLGELILIIIHFLMMAIATSRHWPMPLVIRRAEAAARWQSLAVR